MAYSASGQNWDSNTITWNNAPGNVTNDPYSMNANAVSLLTFTITGRGVAGDTIALESSSLLSFLQNDTDNLVTLMITRDTQAPVGDTNHDVVHQFASLNNTSYAAPSLDLIIAIPEANTTMLLGVGGVLLLVTARKKARL